MGQKLLLVCGLALLMTIPALFVFMLLADRTTRAQAVQSELGASSGGPQTSLGPISAIPLHPNVPIAPPTAQITSAAPPASEPLLIVFPSNGDAAFLIAAVVTVGLISVCAGWVFESRGQGLRALVAFSGLYGLIYVLMRLEDYALLVGAFSSFAAIAAVMYFTRKLDWYGLVDTPASISPPSQLILKDAP
jgi:inner membrane protein involved in colicin E2 resistance